MKDAVRVVVRVMQFDPDEEVRHPLSIMGSLYGRNVRVGYVALFGQGVRFPASVGVWLPDWASTSKRDALAVHEMRCFQPAR